MKTSTLFLCFPALASAIPAVIPATELRNDNATIWAQAAIPVMKASAERIYQASLDVYNQRTIFNQPHAPCKSPPDPGQSSNTLCTRADKITAGLNAIIIEEWVKLGKAIFPVYYGLPDNANQPRATFSDFSHFYNYVFYQAIYAANITQYYACKGFFGVNSASYNNSYYLWPEGDAHGLVFDGPDNEYNATSKTETGNGTGEYYVDPHRPHYYPHFYETWAVLYSAYLHAFGASYDIMFNRPGYKEICPQVETYLKAPIAPGKTAS